MSGLGIFYWVNDDYGKWSKISILSLANDNAILASSTESWVALKKIYKCTF